MHRRSFLALMGGTVMTGCTGIGYTATRSPDHDVGMRSNAFVPREFEVDAGDVVTWRNTSSPLHTVTAYGELIPEEASYFASGGYDSEEEAREGYVENLGGGIYTDETYEHTFEVPGTYDYVCIPHERGGMVGRVIVRE